MGVNSKVIKLKAIQTNVTLMIFLLHLSDEILDMSVLFDTNKLQIHCIMKLIRESEKRKNDMQK